MLPSKEGRWGMLLGVEHIWQGFSWAGQIYNTPGNDSQYFNPGRDYICEISEFEQDTEADWQEDKDWLKDVPADDRRRDQYSRESRQVLEYAQTPQGQWYARKTQKEICYSRSGAGRSKAITLIHLDTEREIPDELFDPDSITPDMFRTRETTPESG